jgi:hypothetical protein
MPFDPLILLVISGVLLFTFLFALPSLKRMLVRDSGAVRHLPLYEGGPGHTCGSCAHFDLEEGQAIIEAYPAFYQATQAITPARMSEKWEDGELVEASPVPHKTKWSEFGACHEERTVLWSGDHCSKWRARS